MPKEVAIKIVLDQVDAQKRAEVLTGEIRNLTKARTEYTQAVKAGTITEKAANEGINRTNIQLKAKRRELNVLNNVQKANNNSLGALRASNARLRAELEGVNTATKVGADRFRVLSKQIGVNQAKLNKLDAATKRYQGNVGNYSSALGGLSGSLRNVATAFGFTGAIFLFANALKEGVKTIASFEKTFTNVITLLDEADRKKWGGLLREGSGDLIREFGFAVEDVNKALFDAISAGIPAGEAIEFMREASILAIGGVTDLTTAVDGVTSVMNAYGLEATETEKVTSAFFSAQKFGKTTVAELSSEIGKVAPIAKTAGISYQELLSTFAELTKQGINTAESSTAIKATITALIKPSVEAKQKFDELGIATGITAVRQKGLFNTLLDVAKATETNADELTGLIPNVRALTGVAALGEDALIDYQKILEQVNTDFGDGSSLVTAYGLQIETLTTRIDLMKGAWDGLFITLGEKETFLSRLVSSIISSTTETLNFLSADIENVRLTWRGIEFDYAEGEKNKTKITKEEADKRLLILNNQATSYAKQIEEEGKSLKEFYGDDFTNYNDILDTKEGAQLKHLFSLAAGTDAEIKKMQEIAEISVEVVKKVGKDTIDYYKIAADAANKSVDDLIAKYKDGQLDGLLDLDTDDFSIDKLLKTFETQIKDDETIRKAWAQNFSNDEEEEISEDDPNIARFKETQEGKRSILKQNLELGIIDQQKYNEEIAKLDQDTTDKKTKNALSYLQVASGFTNALANIFESAKQKELSAAGDNAEEREAIEKKFAKKQQTVSIAQSLISGAEGIVKTGANLGYPLAIPLQIIQGIQTLAQIAVIKSQKFAQGTILSGPSHSQGGIQIYSPSGHHFGEAEGGEPILTANVSKNPYLLNAASDINVAAGGKPLTNRSGYRFQEGTLLPTPSTGSGVSTDTIRSIINETIKGVASIPVNVLENEITSTQRIVSVNENQGDA